MKKLLLFCWMLMQIASVFSYDFSAHVGSSTLYFTITNANSKTVKVVNNWNDNNKPTGDLVIPATVSNGGKTYSVTAIDEDAFRDCIGLTSVTISNSVTYIGDNAFYLCYSLTSVIIPNSVTTIGKGAFQYSGLTSVTIPNSVTIITNDAFSYCHGLTSVTIPNSVTTIESDAFCECNSLKSINIPNSITTIGDRAFKYCDSLISITFPSSVTSIGDYAFYYCDGLSTVTFEGTTPPSIGNNAFAHIYSNAIVYIPCGSLSYFVERMPNIRANNFIDSQISFSAVSEDNNKGTVKILNEPTCVNPSVVINAIAADNYRFDHWSDGNTDNPRLFYVTGDTTLVAYFTPKTSISDLDDSKVKVYAAGNSIVIEFAHAQEYENEPVTVYDVLGREIAKGRLEGNSLRLPVQPSGIYIVQINGLMPYKVVVQ